MTELFNGIVFNFGSSSSIRVVLKYEKRRNGSDMEYRFNYKIYISSSAYYQNNIRAIFTLNNKNVWTQNTQNSNSGWSYEYTSAWFTVEDKVSGTTPFKFTIKDTQNSSWCNYTSSTYKLPIDPAGSDLQAVSNFNIGTSFNVLVTKYASMYDVLNIKIGSNVIRTIENASASNTISFTSSELNTIYELTKGVQSQDFTFELKTYEDSTKKTQVGDTKSVKSKGYIVSSNPVINSLIAVDTNETTIALTGSSSKMIKYASNIKVTVNASGVNSATIKSITVNGVTATNGVVEFASASVNTFNVVVTDSRGFITTDSITLEMVDYIPLTANVNITRNTSTDGKIIIDYSGNYYNGSFGANDNKLLIYYRFKEKNSVETRSVEFSDWISLAPTISNNKYSQKIIVDGFDYSKQYEFEFKAEDELNIRLIAGIVLSKGIPIIWWDEDRVYVYNKEVLEYERTDNTITLNDNVLLDSSSVSYNKNTLKNELDLLNECILLEEGVYDNIITLNDTLANYRRIVIFYKQTGYFNTTYGSVMIENPNGKNVNIHEIFYVSSYGGTDYYGAYLLSRVYSLKDNRMTKINAGNYKIVGTNNTGIWGIGDTIKITKIVGWK